ncbi:Hypothetical predicted protein [Pelobates cultripes]|uniref:Uncharacterized protein n=1 Tax=Pelobates cultripes TaxID=61616 RepID=A0AAD1RMH7_PELCU|nr:Hypothetical predicted protein [Pelobates cultripes]
MICQQPPYTNEKIYSLIVEAIRVHDLWYRWDFPKKPLITKEGGMKTILTPEDGLQKLKSWGLPPPPVEREIQMRAKLSQIGPRSRKNKTMQRTLEGLSKYSAHIHDRIC